MVAAHHKLVAMERRMAAGERSTAETWKHYDREFHRALVAACGSQVLLETHAQIYDRYLRYEMITGVWRGDVPTGDLRTLMKCALGRDWKTAQTGLTRHTEVCVAYMIDKRLAR